MGLLGEGHHVIVATCFRRALDDAPMSPSVIGESELKHEPKDTKMVRRAAVSTLSAPFKFNIII